MYLLTYMSSTIYLMYEKTKLFSHLLLYTQSFPSPCLDARFNSANDTFEPRVSTKSSTTPVACSNCREVLAVGVVSEESTVCLG